MTNRERFKAAYSELTAPPETISEVLKMTTEKNRINGVYKKRTLTLLLAACLVFALCIGGYAAGGHISGWGGNADYELLQDKNGNEMAVTTLYTESLSEPVKYMDGRMIFVVNGENIDITHAVSESNPYIYEYDEFTQTDTITHCILIGLNTSEPGNYGFAEYIRSKESGEWLGGYSARTNTDADGKGAEWLENGKQILGVPW